MIFPVRFPESETVTVKRLTSTQNEMGEIIPDWTGNDTIEVEIWPLSGKQAQSEIGVTEKSTHKAFSLGAFESNVRLVAANGTYLVGYVQNWRSHYTAILELV